MRLFEITELLSMPEIGEHRIRSPFVLDCIELVVIVFLLISLTRLADVFEFVSQIFVKY